MHKHCFVVVISSACSDYCYSPNQSPLIWFTGIKAIRTMMTSSNGNFFPHYWPFVQGIHRSLLYSPHKGPVTRTLMFLWCQSAYAVKQSVELPVIGDYVIFMWRHRYQDCMKICYNIHSLSICLKRVNFYNCYNPKKKPVCNDHLYNKIYYLWFIQ